MKKVLTITCHNVYNHGATLQEYALVRYLQNLGFDAATINYKPPYLSNQYDFWRVSSPRFNKNIALKAAYLALKFPGRFLSLRRKRNFDAFEAKHLSVARGRFTSNEALKANVPKADAYICGSDQIWNSYFENGKDPAFYLDFVPEDKLKISYAASFATDSISTDLWGFVRQKVSRLNSVSVRESSGVRILEDLGISNANRVLDPVFLLDADDWKQTFVTPVSGNYIFIYDFESSPMIRTIAEREAKKHGLKIYSINSNISYADQNFGNKAPDTFVSLVYHARLVITNSFHALAFSLLFNKDFFVVNRSEKINTRMRDLLELAGLPKHLVQSDTARLEDAAIDYAPVNENIETCRAFSKQFLTSALSQIKND